MNKFNIPRSIDKDPSYWLYLETMRSDLLEKIKNGEKLDSNDLNSNISFEYRGLESVTENHKKWFRGYDDENKK